MARLKVSAVVNEFLAVAYFKIILQAVVYLRVILMLIRTD